MHMHCITGSGGLARKIVHFRVLVRRQIVTMAINDPARTALEFAHTNVRSHTNSIVYHHQRTYNVLIIVNLAHIWAFAIQWPQDLESYFIKMLSDRVE